MSGSGGTRGRPVEVLPVEDSPGDVRRTQEAFRDANGALKLHAAFDGVEAPRKDDDDLRTILEAFEALVKGINDFWRTTVHLPPKKSAA